MKDAFNERSSLSSVYPAVSMVRGLSSIIVDVAMQMEPAEGVALLTEAFPAPVRGVRVDGSDVPYMCAAVNVLSRVAAKLDEVAGARVRTNAARILVERMRQCYWPEEGHECLALLLKSVPVVTERMGRAERLRVYEEAAGVLAEAEGRVPGSLDGDTGETFAEITGKLPPEDAARVCTPVVDVLTKAVEVESEPFTLARLAKALAPLAKHVAEPGAQRVRSEVVQKLVRVSSTNPNEETAEAASLLAAGMDSADAAEIRANVARMLVALVKENGMVDIIRYQYHGEPLDSRLAKLARLMPPDEARAMLLDMLLRELGSPNYVAAFAAVVRRMDPVQRARVCAEAIDAVLDRMRSTADAPRLARLANVLAQFAAEMPSEEAAAACAEAAPALIKSMRTVPVDRAYDLQYLAISVLVISSRLKPIERAQICADAAHAMIETRGQDGWANEWADDPWPANMALLTAGMNPREAAPLVASALRVQLAAQLRSVRAGLWNTGLGSALADCLALCDSRTACDTAWLLAQFLCSDACAPVGGGTLYQGSRLDDILSEPPPKNAVEGAGLPARGCRLTTPRLVELLKMPTCFGAARRVILDHLERRYDRRFNTVWAFVRFAEAEHLGLDFTTPPVRPDPAKMQVPAP